ncbi:hypothetical protein, partial [Micromonospora noduli]|uniref:hypothetical protein n=1 Tax=Micromonospora noduli TaxID=709876 RepID=UPI001B87ECA7
VPKQPRLIIKSYVPEQAMNLKLSVLEQTINKKLSVPEQANYLLNVVCSGTGITCFGTSNEPKRVSSGTDNDRSGTNNLKKHT